MSNWQHILKQLHSIVGQQSRHVYLRTDVGTKVLPLAFEQNRYIAILLSRLLDASCYPMWAQNVHNLRDYRTKHNKMFARPLKCRKTNIVSDSEDWYSSFSSTLRQPLSDTSVKPPPSVSPSHGLFSRLHSQSCPAVRSAPATWHSFICKVSSAYGSRCSFHHPPPHHIRLIIVTLTDHIIQQAVSKKSNFVRLV